MNKKANFHIKSKNSRQRIDTTQWLLHAKKFALALIWMSNLLASGIFHKSNLSQPHSIAQCKHVIIYISCVVHKQNTTYSISLSHDKKSYLVGWRRYPQALVKCSSISTGYLLGCELLQSSSLSLSRSRPLVNESSTVGIGEPVDQTLPLAVIGEGVTSIRPKSLTTLSRVSGYNQQMA